MHVFYWKKNYVILVACFFLSFLINYIQWLKKKKCQIGQIPPDNRQIMIQDVQGIWMNNINLMRFVIQNGKFYLHILIMAASFHHIQIVRFII